MGGGGGVCSRLRCVVVCRHGEAEATLLQEALGEWGRGGRVEGRGGRQSIRFLVPARFLWIVLLTSSLYVCCFDLFWGG